jgi:hypothetical protein
MSPAYSDQFDACRDACEKAADACFIAAAKCRSTGLVPNCLGDLDACRAACDRTVRALRRRSTTECLPCVALCTLVASSLKGIDEPDFLWCRDAVQACAQLCGQIAGPQVMLEGWQVASGASPTA